MCTSTSISASFQRPILPESDAAACQSGPDPDYAEGDQSRRPRSITSIQLEGFEFLEFDFAALVDDGLKNESIGIDWHVFPAGDSCRVSCPSKRCGVGQGPALGVVAFWRSHSQHWYSKGSMETR